MVLTVRVHAADPPPAGDQLEEIVVTAEKRSSTVQETPMSLTAVSGTQLESQGIVSVEDLAAHVPGISMRTAGPGQTEYEMRGLASSGGSTATVGFYLDETPLSASAVALNGRTVVDPELFDLSRVEVLRGPQGTLYGAGSMGGTIRLVTNPPKLGSFEGAADVNSSKTTGGSWNGGGSLMLNFPLGDRAALRVVTTEKYLSGWIDRIVVNPFPFPTDTSCGSLHCSRGDVAGATVQNDIKGVNNERFFSTRGALQLRPNDDLSVTASVMYQRIDQDGFNTYQAPPGNEAVYQPYDVAEPYYDSFKLASLTVHYDFVGAQLTSNTSYWKRQVIQSQDSAEPLQNDFNLTQFIPTLYQETDPTRQISQELRLTSTADGPFQWVAGLYFADLHSDLNGHEENPAFANAMGCPMPYSGGTCPPGLAFNITNGGPAANPTGIIFDEAIPNVMKQSAVFGEASYKVTSDLKLTAGLRYFDFKINSLSTQCGVGTGTGNATCTGGPSSGKGKNFLPKLNLSYTPTRDLTLYGTGTQGSRPGGVNTPSPRPTPAQLAANPQAINCGPGSGPIYVTSQPSTYGPDSIWSFELGEKARFADQRFAVNSDIYYVKWQNIQQVIVPSCGYPFNTNAGDARAYGPEIETYTRIIKGLTFDLSGAYTSAQINNPSAQSGILPGTKLLNVPKYTAAAALNYEWPVASGYNGSLRISDSLVGPVEDQAYYRQTLPSYSLVDLRAGLTGGSWSAYLVATNHTDKRAALTINNTTFAWQQPTITRVSTNQPRTVGIDVQYRF